MCPFLIIFFFLIPMIKFRRNIENIFVLFLKHNAIIDLPNIPFRYGDRKFYRNFFHINLQSNASYYPLSTVNKFLVT